MFDWHIAVNLKGTFNMMREAATRLRRGGRIINFSSSVVGLLQPTYGVYAGTKATANRPSSSSASPNSRPLDRLGQPDDIAAALAFLAGPDGAWINGQTLRATGGMI
jgi:3-oxoacyl-[acyl-carrier protein] reductase